MRFPQLISKRTMAKVANTEQDRSNRRVVREVGPCLYGSYDAGSGSVLP